MLVTREADYAVRCVAEVARVGRTSAAQVARSQGISPTFLGKIVQSLARAGILATRRGVGGGIALAGPPESFTLLQVIEAVEGPLSIVECLRSPEGCPQAGGCPAYPYLSTAQALMREALDVTFAELLEGDPMRSTAAPDEARPQPTAEAVAGNGHRARTPDPAARGADR